MSLRRRAQLGLVSAVAVFLIASAIIVGGSRELPRHIGPVQPALAVNSLAR